MGDARLNKVYGVLTPLPPFIPPPPLFICPFLFSLVRFAAKKNIDLTNCRFTFDGEAIEDDATPLSLELEQGDEIDAFTSQTGGGAGSAGNRSGKSWRC